MLSVYCSYGPNSSNVLVFMALLSLGFLKTPWVKSVSYSSFSYNPLLYSSPVVVVVRCRASEHSIISVFLTEIMCLGAFLCFFSVKKTLSAILPTLADVFSVNILEILTPMVCFLPLSETRSLELAESPRAKRHLLCPAGITFHN